ncbi:hypothetical protein [Nocardia sp. XZ_19_369]|uniref:hypothetical protein n=1 Tax=Nocardia sp. XZ_19_369 TaxID=2769487 RepID=UPI00188DD24F|nr:hypothetical protein [Nocardia sp. XZ_19_369]
MESLWEKHRRRRDEELLRHALLLGSGPNLPEEIVQALWAAVARTPRWRAARVTPDNAAARLEESRNGIRYTSQGRRVIGDRRTRRRFGEYLRRARESGDSADADKLSELLEHGRRPPPDWEDSGRWYSAHF